MAKPHSDLTPDHALAERTERVDGIVRAAWKDHLAACFASGLSLVAVGGYGRRDLFPHSDIDLLLLVEREPTGDQARAAISGFLRALWDARLRLSQSVRTISDCCSFDANNVELAISLIDQRFLTGDRTLYDALSARLPRLLDSQRVTLMRHLAALTQARHAKFQNTIFHLEPNVKETPGGLRDLHVVHWLERLRNASVVSEAELAEARDFLARTRSYLHRKYGRDANVLTFEAQQEFAPNPAEWMRRYFRCARQIHLAVLRELEGTEALTENSLLRQFRDWRSRLSNADFSVSRERVFFRAPAQLETDPLLAVQLFVFAARHGLRLALETYRRIQEHLPSLRVRLSQPGPVWPYLRELLVQRDAARALRAMHESGLLLAIFPEWADIDCLVVRDFYHRYTVDEHSIVAIETVAALQHSAGSERFASLCGETEDLPLLYVALLFHDAGKAQGLESHSERSTALAAAALERIQMPAPQRSVVLFLIEHHLALSAVMLGRDMEDPAAIRELAQRVGTVENLKLLTLLTYADISAVNPGAMTPWRAELLWRVYLRTYNELTRELESDRIGDAHAGSEHADFLRGLPVRYLRRHSPEEIALHAGLEQASAQTGVALHLVRRNGYHELTVVAADRPRLFASVAGALSSFGMNIVKAEAFANSNGNVVDTFVFADPMRTLELNPSEADRLRQTVQRVLLGREDVARLLKGRARPAAPPALKASVTPTVAFDSEACATATLAEIVAEDRPGLLYDLASVFSDNGCNIDVVLIDTEAHKAIDVFYVNASGAKLAPEVISKLETELLRVCEGPL